MCEEVDGVKFCEYAEDVNKWIANNPDKVVVDVKLSSAYNVESEQLSYCCLILYKNK
jgi:hypothetical protein